MRGLGRLAAAVKLVLRVQQKSHFLTVYFGVALATIAFFRLAIPEDWIPLALPAVLLGEPGTMTVYLVGAYRYLEKNERSWTALLVTPLGLHEYLLALVLASSLIATAAGSLVVAVVLGPERALLAAGPLFLTANIAGLLGFALSLHYPEFTRFIVGSIPYVTVYSLPFLTLIGMVPAFALRILPSTASIQAFRILSGPEPSLGAVLAETAVLLAFDVVMVLAVARHFSNRLALELA